MSIFSGRESVIQDKTINDSIPADFLAVKVDFKIKFSARRILIVPSQGNDTTSIPGDVTTSFAFAPYVIRHLNMYC